MTQPPYYPQQYSQPPVQQPQYPQYPPQGQQPAYPQYPQQVGGWPQMPPAPPAQPQVPLAEGSLDDFFNQPSAGGGPAVSWKDKQNGYTVAGIVARAIGKGDVQQQTDPQTKQPKFFRDGRPQFVMRVPLRVQPSPEFPEGEAQLYVRGQLRDELVRAMTETGAPANAAPEEGAGIVVTLLGRKPSRGGGNPSNVFQVRYQRPQGANGAAATSPASAPAHQQQPVQQPQQFDQGGQWGPQGQQPPVQQPQQYDQNQFQQPYGIGAKGYDPQADAAIQAQMQQQIPQGQPQQYQQPAPQQQYAQPQAQQQVPQGQPPMQPQPPEDLTPDQQALLARITGGAQ